MQYPSMCCQSHFFLFQYCDIQYNVTSLQSEHLSDTAQGHPRRASQAASGQRVDLKRNVQSIDPNSVGLWFLILRPDFSQL